MFKTLNRLFKVYVVNIKLKLISIIFNSKNIHVSVKTQIGNFILDNAALKYYLLAGTVCDADEMMSKMTGHIGKCLISFDVGANTGITTVWLAKHSRKVYAFEPEMSNCNTLKCNLLINQINNVKLENTAISNFNGYGTLHILEGYGHHSLGNPKTTSEVAQKKVKIQTIDSYCYKNKIDSIDILKVDVEGFEAEVLKGAKKMIKGKKIKFIVFEISDKILLELNKDKMTIFNFLTKNKYFVKNLDNEILSVDQFKNYVQNDLFATYLA